MHIYKTIKDRWTECYTILFERIKNLFKTIKDRWNSKSPKLFKRITNIGCSVSAIAISVNLALVASGANEPQWWVNIFPYLVGIPAGMAAVAKLTKENGRQDNQNL